MQHTHTHPQAHMQAREGSWEVVLNGGQSKDGLQSLCPAKGDDGMNVFLALAISYPSVAQSA